MTIAHSARKIIKTQRFIFRALPALLVSMFVLNACAGAVPVTVSNSSLSEAEIAKLREDAKQANDAKESADDDITRLKNDLATAEGARDTANDMITDLKGKLSTAIGNKDTADGTITTLRGQLSTAEGARDTANDKITDLQGQLSTAEGARDTANDMITDLKKALRLAEEARLKELRDNHSVIEFADWAGTAEEPKTTVKNADNTGTWALLNGAAGVGNNIPNASVSSDFIQGLAIVEGQGFDFTGTAFADATVTGDVLLLGENSPSGVAFSRVSGTGVTSARNYAGLLPTTNLGAPITDISTNAIWDAKIMLITSPNRHSNPDFKMQVIFDGSEGTINSGTVSDGVFTNGVVSLASDSSNTDISIEGRFGSDGLLYGMVTLVDPSFGWAGTLTGLIGVDGAVGAFVTRSARPYAGGFVAYPTDPRIAELEDELSTAKSERDSATGDKNAANLRIAKLEEQIRLIEDARISFIDWAGTAEAPKTTVKNADDTGTEILLNGAAGVGNDIANIKYPSNFIQGLPTLAGQGFDFTGTAFADANIRGDVLLLADNSPSGVAFSTVYGTGVTNPRAYAGLLPTTNLGAPITNINTDAIWDAKVMLRGLPNRYSNLDFKMQVIFDGSEGTINSGTISGGVFTAGEISVPYTDSGSGGSHPFNIQGRFGSDGLLYGTVTLDAPSTDSGRLTGLIGADGAVGAITGFRNITGVGPYAGGFVAYPTGTDPRIAELEDELSTAKSERDSATGDKNAANSRIEKLEEQIRLIEDARISFTDWAGTAEAPKTTVIDSAGTGTLPLLNGVASVGNGNPVTNFIQGLATNIHGFDFTGTAFSSATTTGGVLLLAENSPSGVAFSYVTGTGVTGEKLYAGLLPTTNLGAPITDINTDAIWDAKVALVSALNLFSINSFKMRVIFDGSEGTINSGTVSDGSFTNGAVSIPSYDGTLNIQGKFGSDGLLYGTVAYDSDTANGTLTGLIGVDGAVGAFVSDFGAGGFVAYPTDPRIAELEEELRLAKNDRDSATGDKNAANLRIAELEEELRLANEQIEAIIDRFSAKYSNWVAEARPDATADLTNPRGQILQSKDGTLDTTGVTLCRDFNGDPRCGAVGSRTAPRVFNINSNLISFDGRPINGDINDGYARFDGWIGETRYYYAGILDSTDLGLPLTGDAGTSVQWNGRGNFGDFILTITFDAAGGRLDAFIHIGGNEFHRFQDVRFDAGGVITGTVNYQYFTDSDPTKPIDTATDGEDNTGDSVLSGIIGQEGMVAVFAGAGFASGFFAGPDFAFNPDVRGSDWLPKIGEFVVPFTSVPRNQFLTSRRREFLTTQGTGANSDGTGDIADAGLNLSTATFGGSPLGGDDLVRISFFSGYNGGTRHYYAGMDSANSDLDATLPAWETGQPASAEWKGAFGVVQGANDVANADLTLEVNFENRRLTAFVPVGTNHYLLEAGFNADDDGFFAGTVNFGAFTDTTNRTSTNTLTSGVLTGIIGAEGAVGAFVSGSTTDNGRTITGGEGENGFAGGFVACPYDETDNECKQ